MLEIDLNIFMVFELDLSLNTLKLFNFEQLETGSFGSSKLVQL